MKNKLVLPAIILSICLVAFVAVNVARANPSYFATPVATASATTTSVYLAAGQATTLVLDSYYSTGAGSYTKVNSAKLLVQMGASSTASLLSIRNEFASGSEGIDCKVLPELCTWFSESTVTTTTATSTYATGFAETLMSFASSTTGGKAVTATLSTTTRAIDINTPTRYTRVVFSVPSGSASAINLWAQLVPVKERAE